MMPLAAYFRNVGAVLFALLLIADFYLPAPPVVERAAVSPPVIRIHSDGKSAAPVVFDTTQVVVTAATPAPWDRNPPLPKVAVAMTTDRIDTSGIHDAFALLPPQGTHRATSIERKKPPQKYVARNVRKHARPQIVLAARQGQFNWFGFRYW